MEIVINQLGYGANNTSYLSLRLSGVIIDLIFVWKVHKIRGIVGQNRRAKYRFFGEEDIRVIMY